MADISKQVIGGKWGRCFTVINGVREELLGLKDVEITYEKSKSEVNQLNDPVTKHKTNGVTYMGGATVFYNTARFRKLVMEYAETGKDIYFDIEITNEDAGSDAGRQIVIATGCNINGGTIASLDVESDVLEEVIEFSVNGIKILEEFTSN